MVIYEFLRLIVHCVYRLLFRYEAYGQENIPEEGAVLLCANHLSNWDPPFVGLTVKRRVNYMAKQELFRIPVLRTVIRWFGAFPVKRGATDKKAIRTALERLREGKVVLIFPEGTRSKTGQLGKAFPGSGFLALREKCTVIPVAIIGPFRLFHKVKIIYGPPIDLEDLRKPKAGRAEAEEATKRIMEGIGRLLKQNGGATSSNGASFVNGV